VRYINRLIENNLDAGEAETVSEQENAVRLMTIHKSKGLEFPIVFVAGMGKKFNRMDSTTQMILNPNYGIGLKWCDADRRVKTNTLIRRAFSVEAQRESLGEEQRILYVALTRAREKLVITGMKPGGSIRESAGVPSYQKLDFSVRMDAETGWDWILPALLSCGGTYPLEIATPEAQAVDAARRQVSNARERESLLNELREVEPDFLEELSRRFSWEYPYRTSGIKQKMSVSEIKHRAMEEARDVLEEDEGEELFPEETPIPYIPKFIKEPDENGGALRGTAFHRLMECLDFSSVPAFSDPVKAGEWAEHAAKQLCDAGRMERSEAELIDPVKVGRFLCTDLTGRMKSAADAGSLLKEQPFVMSVPADRVREGAGQSEQVLIQGIIDVFWEEDDGIVLLDYKTDQVNRPEELIRRYEAQLLLYAEALGRRFDGKGVKEILIYSFCLDQVISISPQKE
ncbi:MAG: PD-(D/E)XK nuclease family protein, partial [Clostridiales bacterium]|nr:PD-(D/E)XK nuclease family protein [Clostridiales bacterium]